MTNMTLFSGQIQITEPRHCARSTAVL